ncbi:MAG: DUF4168 domain-containing protein [Symploca sp. SIO2E6]|nr:DUF4168 domain-containing protein [Symploca sp. SIO2E6]
MTNPFALQLTVNFQPSTVNRQLSSPGGEKFSKGAALCLLALALAAFTVILAGCASNRASDSEVQSSPPLTVSSEEVENYAKVVLAIESKREAATQEILRITKKDNLPKIVCTQPKTITRLRRNVRGIAVNYCQQAKDISESNGLKIVRFNDITAAAKSDEQLKIRIQNELVRLQK